MVVWNTLESDAVVESLRLQPGSAGNIVYSKLKQRNCQSGAAGTALSEKEVSILRGQPDAGTESFVRLAQEDLVVVLPQRGTRVSLIDSELVEEARFMREQLEKAVVRLACESFPWINSPIWSSICPSNARASRSMTASICLIWMRPFIVFCSKVAVRSAHGTPQQMNAHLNRSRMLWLSADPNWTNLYEQASGDRGRDCTS